MRELRERAELAAAQEAASNDGDVGGPSAAPLSARAAAAAAAAAANAELEERMAAKRRRLQAESRAAREAEIKRALANVTSEPAPAPSPYPCPVRHPFTRSPHMYPAPSQTHWLQAPTRRTHYPPHPPSPTLRHPDCRRVYSAQAHSDQGRDWRPTLAPRRVTTTTTRPQRRLEGPCREDGGSTTSSRRGASLVCSEKVEGVIAGGVCG